VTHR